MNFIVFITPIFVFIIGSDAIQKQIQPDSALIKHYEDKKLMNNFII